MVKMSGDPPTPPLQLTNGSGHAAPDAERASSTSSHEMDGEPSWGSIQAYQQQHGSAAAGQHMHGMYANGNGQHQDELDRRKFTRNLLSANNKKESLERYKAIMSLIEACRRRLELQLGPAAAAAVLAEAAWAQEPLVSLLQSVLDVGEALASFGNCHFPEHSNEARAILAGDYRALLKQYLSSFGFVFAQPTKQQLTHDMQEEVQCVGSLLATRCDAYDLLYDQLVRHVGLEGRGGPSTVVINHNNASAAPNTSITANPTNTTSASAASKSKALNQGLGAAAIAAAGLLGLLLLRGLRGASSRRSRRGGSSNGSSGGDGQQQQQRPLRVPNGKNGRELLLVSQLTGCADELRKARQNEELLKDDWRLGRHVRLAWPPGPPLPPGFADGAPDACNVGQLLQEMYG